MSQENLKNPFELVEYLKRKGYFPEEEVAEKWVRNGDGEITFKKVGNPELEIIVGLVHFNPEEYLVDIKDAVVTRIYLPTEHFTFPSGDYGYQDSGITLTDEDDEEYAGSNPIDHLHLEKAIHILEEPITAKHEILSGYLPQWNEFNKKFKDIWILRDWRLSDSNIFSINESMHTYTFWLSKFSEHRFREIDIEISYNIFTEQLDLIHLSRSRTKYGTTETIENILSLSEDEFFDFLINKEIEEDDTV